MRYSFDQCVLDLVSGTFKVANQEVTLRPKAFQLLRFLIENQGRLVPKDELMEAVWRTSVVTDKSLTNCISELRRALRDGEQRVIRTVSRRGYIFTPSVSTQQVGLTEGPTSGEPTFPDKPSVVVLPFINMSEDPRQEYFSDGITEDITTELSRFTDLFVIARNSAFQYKGKSLDVRQIGRELGVRYILEGSVRRDGGRIRVTAQLVDAHTGAHRWADRYDRELDDVFAVQDEVARTIVTILAAQVSNAEVDRRGATPTPRWNAYDYYLQAQARYAVFHRAMKVATLYEARQLLDQCLAIDATFARAYVLWSTTKTTSYVLPIDSDQFTDEAIDTAHQLARKAIEFGDQLPEAHAQLGYVLGFLRQYDLASP